MPKAKLDLTPFYAEAASAAVQYLQANRNTLLAREATLLREGRNLALAITMAVGAETIGAITFRSIDSLAIQEIDGQLHLMAGRKNLSGIGQHHDHSVTAEDYLRLVELLPGLVLNMTALRVRPSRKSANANSPVAPRR